DPLWRKPITGVFFCCARAASGHTVAPPARLINSRRLIPVSPKGIETSVADERLCAPFGAAAAGRPHCRRYECPAGRDRDRPGDARSDPSLANPCVMSSASWLSASGSSLTRPKPLDELGLNVAAHNETATQVSYAYLFCMALRPVRKRWSAAHLRAARR